MTRPPVIMVVAAEASGDVLGADLIRALRTRLPAAQFIGVGGERMEEAGIVSPFDISELSIFGVFEAFGAYSRVKRRVREVAAMAARENPDVAILIDSWGFTSRLAKAIRRRRPAIRLVKYVGPQVWASRPGRARVLAGLFDHLLTILPFDAPFYQALNIPVTFVGNPALARELDDADPQPVRDLIEAREGDDILLLLPGSRPGEIRRVMPSFEVAASLLKTERPDLHVVIPAATTVARAVKARAAALPFTVHVLEGDALKRGAMKAATAAIACSGTVTTELALAGCPMVVGYRMGGASYAIVRRIITTRYAVLLNIAADRFVVPEFIQDDMTGPALADAVAVLLDNPVERVKQVSAQNAALREMGRGGPDPSEKAADVIVGIMGRT